MSRQARAVDVVTSLQAQISRFTGRVPVSRNVRYLEMRLADLERRNKAGESTFTAARGATRVVSISLTERADAALERMTTTTRLGRSALVRAALSEYAIHHNMHAEADCFVEED